MSANEALAARLHEMSQLMDLLGIDSFRSSAHARAARAIESQSTDIALLASDRKALLAVEGIGPKMADKIIEFCKDGKIKEHAELLEQVPQGLLQLLDIPGLGPKTIRIMWQDGKVTDLAGLEKSIADGSILSLPRMGAKSVEKIKQSIAFIKQQGGAGGDGAAPKRLWIGVAQPIADRVVALLQKAGDPGLKVAFAGSLRRGKETIGDIDILAAPRTPDEAGRIMTAFCKMPGIIGVLVSGDVKASVRVGLEGEFGRWGNETVGSGGGIQMDLKMVPPDSWGAAMMYFTGSKEHNIAMRERARKRGLTLTDYGLFPEDDPDKKLGPPHSRGIKSICPADTEEALFKALEVAYAHPETREDLGEIGWKQTPHLIELPDIKAELHAHTTASDGRMSIEELAENAKARGFHTIAVTDHSQSSAVAGGLKVDRLLEHIENIRKASAKVKGITILAGSEVDILADGQLDYPDDILAKLDIVVASPHAGLSQDPITATARLLRAIENPYIHILGHPTGRQINKRPGLSPDMAKLYAAAKLHNVALEINTHWIRLDLRDIHIRGAMEAGCLLAIDSDVHETVDFDNLRYGILTARRGGVTPDRCINTWDSRKLHAWLNRKRK
ncbi:MAG: PHP domain-containing protein [Phycisphaerales bacterium]|nr:PHP domain-containing protein [Phycisphaerales bacterium]